MNLSYIFHKKTMSITSFIYRSNLGLVYKESLSRIVAFLGVPISESAGKPTMIEKIDSYVKSNPIEVLEKLCVSVCYDKKTRKGNLLMVDELRELFAPP